MYRRVTHVNERRKNRRIELVPVHPDAYGPRREKAHHQCRAQVAVGHGHAVVKGRLVTHADDGLAAQPAGPGRYGLEIRDDDVVGGDVEGQHVAQKLPVVVAQHRAQVIDVTVDIDEGHAAPRAVVAKVLHVEEAFRRAPAEQPVHGQHVAAGEGGGHGPCTTEVPLPVPWTP
jgi:hypothetical protein